MHLLKKVWFWYVSIPIVLAASGIIMLINVAEMMAKEELAKKMIEDSGFKNVKIMSSERIYIGNTKGTHFHAEALNIENLKSTPSAFIPDNREEKKRR